MIHKILSFIEGFMPSWVKIRIYQRRGYIIHSSVKIRPFAKIFGCRVVIEEGSVIGIGTLIDVNILYIGKNVKISRFVHIVANECHLGDESTIGNDSRIVSTMEKTSFLKMGHRCVISSMCYVDCSYGVSFDLEAGIGGSSMIFSQMTQRGISIFEGFKMDKGEVTLGARAWIPVHVIFLPNSAIGDYSIVSAGSSVTSIVPPFSLAVGCPAKVLIPNAGYLEKFDSSDKKLRISDILRNFYLEMKFKGHDIFLRQEGVILTIIYNRKKIVCIDNKSCQHHFGKKFDVIISSELMESLITGVDYFDLERRISSKELSAESLDIKKYFSWYGILFETVDSEKFVGNEGNPHARKILAMRGSCTK